MIHTRNTARPYLESNLIELASRGELDAFNQLVLHYQDMVFQHAFALMGDPDLAEDVAQESFIKTFQKINSYRGGSFRAWLLRIVTNTAYDTLRQSKQHVIQPLFAEDEDGDEVESSAWLADRGPSVEEIIKKKEEMQQLHEILAALPDDQRSAITLIDFHELDYAEAARVLNVPVGTIKSRLARARLQVRNRVYGHKDTLNPSCSATTSAAGY